jgi:hypothetical protein
MDMTYLVPVQGEWTVIEPEGRVGRVIAWLIVPSGTHRAFYIEPAGGQIKESSFDATYQLEPA